MESQTVKAGFGWADLTPPSGLEMAGFSARTEPATGVHDPLLARALYLQPGDSPATGLLLVTFDLIGLSQQLVGRIKRLAEERFAIPPQRTLLACSHTHGGPGTLDHDILGRHDRDYLEGLPERVTGAIRQALDSLEPARLYLAQAEAEGAGRNRNVPDGPADPWAGALAIRRPDHPELLGCVLNYTCHPTVLGPTNLLYTADYPYYTNRVVALATGLPTERILFTQGACGNINAGHTAKSSLLPGAQQLRTYAEAEKLGGRVGQAAVRALALIQADPHKYQLELAGPLAVRQQAVGLDWEQTAWPTPETLKSFQAEKEQLLAAAGSPAERGDPATLLRWSGTMLRQPDLPVLEPLNAPLTAAGLGRLIWLAVPGELYVEYGLALKAAARRQGRQVWVLGYTNGDLGYFPTGEAFERQDYEAATAYRYYGWPAPFTNAVGEQVGAAAEALLNRIIEDQDRRQ